MIRWPLRPAPRLLLLLVAVAACEVPSLPDRSVVPVRNTCVDDAGCGEGGVCAPEGVCYAATSSLGRVVLAVTPAGDSATPTFIDRTIPPAALAPARSLRLQSVLRGRRPVLLSLTPRFRKGEKSAAECQWRATPGGIIGVRATILPTGPIAGLPTRLTFATSLARPRNEPQPETWELAMLVPPSSQDLAYDFYLTPLDDDECPIPPILARNVTLENDSTRIEIALSAGRPLSGTIRLPAGQSFLGYSVEIVDGATGLKISNADKDAFVGSAPDGNAPFGRLVDGEFKPLEYSLPTGVENPRAILRFVPPDGAVAPTLLWDVAAIDVAGTGKVALDVSDLATRVVSVEGRVEPDDVAVGTPSQVFFRSRSRGLVGEPAGVPAFFTATVETTIDGVFRANLLAGEYDVTALPLNDRQRTLARQRFQLAAQPPNQAGRLLQLPARPAIRARLVGRGDEPLGGVFVDASPQGRAASDDPFEVARRDKALAVASQTALTEPDGTVAIRTDAVLATVTAKIDSASRYPWAIAPRVAPSSSVYELRPTNPVELFGLVTNDRGPMPFAVIRAYARVPAATGDGDYVAIGETIAGPDGSYSLLLPSSFSP